MTSDSIVTIVGTAVTLLGMAITIWQASQARSYKNQIKFDTRKINITNVAERLKRAQDEIRRLPTSATSKERGVQPVEIIRKIRENFDIALSTLDATGPDANVRALIVEGQGNLNSYEISWNFGKPNAQDVYDLQSKMQDVVSVMSNTIYEMEGKA
ncbi:MAG: hypothetical protein PHT19_10360 [Methylococcus sp.]|nr:hypothetical protein [Methylococcus sp.]